MSAFERIIGYDRIKSDLVRIADTLKHPDTYRAFGATPSRGLLLYGEPGVGKSLMAECLIEESGRRAFVCRKADPDGEFVKTITRAFDDAVAAAPSIVYLDDMDKFANDDEHHCNSEEYVTVQSCIDAIKGEDVFVLATVNERHRLPRSLTRAGRFDRTIEVTAPEGDDAVLVIEHYLGSKRLSQDLDARVIADILMGRSCATLETVLNEAGLIAGYERADAIGMRHVVEACMKVVFHATSVLTNGERPDLSRVSRESQIVWHEAGHIAVSEMLCPGSVVIASARRRSSKSGGFVAGTFASIDDGVRARRADIAVSLGGRAAVDVQLGVPGSGCDSDIDSAMRAMQGLVEDLAICGFSLCKDLTASDDLDSRIEIAAAAAVEELYFRVKELLCANRSFLEGIAHALVETDVILAADIAAIRERCGVVETALL